MGTEEGKTRWGWKVGVVLIAVCVVSVLVQVFWPGQKFMALTRVGGVDVGGLTREEAKAVLIQNYDEGEVEGMMDRELAYPMWERLVPFSWVIRAVKTRV